MTNRLIKIILFYLLSVIVCTAYADFTSPAATGVGEVADHMMDPVGLMADFVNSACFIIGGAFLFASLIKYIEHKRSPLMVPISTVIFLVIAGIILVGLPFLAFIADGGVRYIIFR